MQREHKNKSPKQFFLISVELHILQMKCIAVVCFFFVFDMLDEIFSAANQSAKIQSDR